MGRLPVAAALLSILLLTPARAADSSAAQPGTIGQPPSSAEAGTEQPGVAEMQPPNAPVASFRDGITVEEMAALLREAGYRADVRVGAVDGQPYISSRAGGLNFWINFYGCKGEPPRCSDIEFQTNLETTPEQRAKAVQWMADKVFGRPYSLDDSTYFAHPVRLSGGVLPENVLSQVDLWEALLGDFTKYIDW